MKKTVLIIMSIILVLYGIIFYIDYTNESVETLSKYGSTGNEVKQIQQRLKEWGYYTGNVDRDLWK